MKNNTTSLSKVEQNFRELIIEQCRFCQFDKYLEDNSDFELPKITEDLLQSNVQNFITIPGMFGGFTYYLEEVNNKLTLHAEQSSRMDYDSNSYRYFEITEDGSRMLEGKEREVVWNKFWELAKEAHKEHKRKMEKVRIKHEPSE